MKTWITVCSILFSFQLAKAQSATSPGKSHIDTVVNAAAQTFLHSKGTVGVSVGIYLRDSIYLYNYGSVSKEKQQLPTAYTLYPIASVSKTFTGLLLARAVTEGKLRLDDDISTYLDSSYPNLAYLGQPIKLYHLISHVSGLPFFLSNQAEKPGYTRADFYRDLHQVKLDTLPGIKFRYSNAAVQLLGYILGKVYGRTYEDLLRQKITGPLKMQHTRVTLTAKDRKYAASNYNADGSFNPQNYDYMQGAAGIKSCVSEMLQYLRYQVVFNDKDAAIALSRKESWGFNPAKGKHYSYALGWQIVTTSNGLHRVSQDGNLANCSSVIIFCPELQAGIVILTNSNAPDPVSAMAQAILQQLVPGMP